MALRKIEDFNGVDCNYWKILSLRQDYVHENTTAVLGLYKDSETREEDVNNVILKRKVCAPGVFTTRELMYEECKASGYYLEDAEDC